MAGGQGSSRKQKQSVREFNGPQIWRWRWQGTIPSTFLLYRFAYNEAQSWWDDTGVRKLGAES